MVYIRQISDILSHKPRFEITNMAYLSFDLIDWNDRKVYNIKFESGEELDKCAMWTESEWISNLPIMERRLIA
jgi:hypothetical protein